MTRWLKSAYYRWRFGPQRAALILRAEDELESLRLRIGANTLDWFWSLPDEAWLGQIEIWRETAGMAEFREEAVRIIARKNRLATLLENARRQGSKTAEELRKGLEAAEEAVERLKTEARLREEKLRRMVVEHRERFGSPPPDDRGLLATLEFSPQEAQMGDWQSWIESLPTERQEEMVRARVVLDEITELRRQLVTALDQRGLIHRTLGSGSVFHTEAKTRAKHLEKRLSQLYRTYDEAAGPLFGAFGRPKLEDPAASPPHDAAEAPSSP